MDTAVRSERAHRRTLLLCTLWLAALSLACGFGGDEADETPPTDVSECGDDFATLGEALGDYARRNVASLRPQRSRDPRRPSARDFPEGLPPSTIEVTVVWARRGDDPSEVRGTVAHRPGDGAFQLEALSASEPYRVNENATFPTEITRIAGALRHQLESGGCAQMNMNRLMVDCDEVTPVMQAGGLTLNSASVTNRSGGLQVRGYLEAQSTLAFDRGTFAYR